ncbi:RNA-directed DNA polymerase, eukaryota, reverse transcriptase zinc-binding domain protein [Tanacetum coccineum]
MHHCPKVITVRILPIGSRDTVNRTRVPVSRIFDRLRNIPWNSVESNYMTHTGCSVCGASFRAQYGDLETISLEILYTSFMISSLFASSVVTKLGSKNALLLGTTAKRRKTPRSAAERRMVRDGRDIRFWVDRWVDNQRLCDRFPRNIRGRVSKELEDLLGVVQHVVISSNCKDRWKWLLSKDGEFTVKELSRLIEEKILVSDNGGREMIWNKLVPKKVNIFVWRALRGRLPVCVELDRRGVDLDSVLCPSCNNIMETCSHSLITCDLAMGVWDKIFSWWKAVCVNAFSLDEFFSLNGNVNVPTYFSRVWQAVIWSTGYFIWKERNACVFGNKISSTNKIVQDIQLRSYEWIVRRSNKYKDIDWQRWLRDLLGFIFYVTKLLRVRSGLDLVIAYD